LILSFSAGRIYTTGRMGQDVSRPVGEALQRTHVIFHIPVNGWEMPFLIGARGRVINRIRDETGVSVITPTKSLEGGEDENGVVVPSDLSFQIDEEKMICKVIGKAYQVYDAVRMIEENVMVDECWATFPVSKRDVPYLIGQKGSTVKALQSSLRGKLSVPPREQDSSILRVEGFPEDMEDVFVAVFETLFQKQVQRRSDLPQTHRERRGAQQAQPSGEEENMIVTVAAEEEEGEKVSADEVEEGNGDSKEKEEKKGERENDGGRRQQRERRGDRPQRKDRKDRRKAKDDQHLSNWREVERSVPTPPGEGGSYKKESSSGAKEPEEA